MSNPTQFDDVSVICKANVYFGGGVVSHTLKFKDGSKKTIGLIRPGSYTFDTDAAELMQIVGGLCSVKLKDENEWQAFEAGTAFRVPAKSAFDIAVETGLAEYVCTFE